jgi:hypothetical protein
VALDSTDSENEPPSSALVSVLDGSPEQAPLVKNWKVTVLPAGMEFPVVVTVALSWTTDPSGTLEPVMSLWSASWTCVLISDVPAEPELATVILMQLL